MVLPKSLVWSDRPIHTKNCPWRLVLVNLFPLHSGGARTCARCGHIWHRGPWSRGVWIHISVLGGILDKKMLFFVIVQIKCVSGQKGRPFQSFSFGYRTQVRGNESCHVHIGAKFRKTLRDVSVDELYVQLSYVCSMYNVHIGLALHCMECITYSGSTLGIHVYFS